MNGETHKNISILPKLISLTSVGIQYQLVFNVQGKFWRCKEYRIAKAVFKKINEIGRLKQRKIYYKL